MAISLQNLQKHGAKSVSAPVPKVPKNTQETIQTQRLKSAALKHPSRSGVRECTTRAWVTMSHSLGIRSGAAAPTQGLRASRRVSRARAPHGLSVTAQAANSPHNHRAVSPAKPRPGSVLAQPKTVTQSDTAVNATAAGFDRRAVRVRFGQPRSRSHVRHLLQCGRKLRRLSKDVVVRRGGQPLGGGRVVARSGRGAHPGATQPPRDPAHHATLR